MHICNKKTLTNLIMPEFKLNNFFLQYIKILPIKAVIAPKFCSSMFCTSWCVILFITATCLAIYVYCQSQHPGYCLYCSLKPILIYTACDTLTYINYVLAVYKHMQVRTYVFILDFIFCFKIVICIYIYLSH